MISARESKETSLADEAQLLVTAIRANDEKKVEERLQRARGNLKNLINSGNNENIAHLISRSSNFIVFEMVYEALKKEDSLHLFNQADIKGQTPLHIAAQCSTLPIVESILEALGDADTITLAVNRVTHYGKRPIHLVADNPYIGERQKIIDLLYSHMFNHTYIPFSELMDFKKILANYPPDCPDKKLIQFSCLVVNIARIIASEGCSTHLEMNAEILEKRKEMISKIKIMRQSKTITEHLLQATVGDVKLLNQSIIDNAFNHALQYKVANCGELSMTATKIARDLDPTLLLQSTYIDRDDHCFLVINDRVICDPWSGPPLLKGEIAKLKYYYFDSESARNSVGPINLEYFSFKPEMIFPPESKLTFSDSKSFGTTTPTRTEFDFFKIVSEKNQPFVLQQFLEYFTDNPATIKKFIFIFIEKNSDPKTILTLLQFLYKNSFHSLLEMILTEYTRSESRFSRIIALPIIILNKHPGYEPIVELLLTLCSIKQRQEIISFKDLDKRTLLHVAIWNNHSLKIIETIFATLAEEKIRLNVKICLSELDNDDRNPLQNAMLIFDDKKLKLIFQFYYQYFSRKDITELLFNHDCSNLIFLDKLCDLKNISYLKELLHHFKESPVHKVIFITLQNIFLAAIKLNNINKVIFLLQNDFVQAMTVIIAFLHCKDNVMTQLLWNTCKENIDASRQLNLLKIKFKKQPAMQELFELYYEIQHALPKDSTLHAISFQLSTEEYHAIHKQLSDIKNKQLETPSCRKLTR